MFHGHPLNGTKFFTWGQGGPGRFMQDFLGGGAGLSLLHSIFSLRDNRVLHPMIYF